MAAVHGASSRHMEPRAAHGARQHMQWLLITDEQRRRSISSNVDGCSKWWLPMTIDWALNPSASAYALAIEHNIGCRKYLLILIDYLCLENIVNTHRKQWTIATVFYNRLTNLVVSEVFSSRFQRQLCANTEYRGCCCGKVDVISASLLINVVECSM